jgi:hypothetical protein
MRSDRLFLRRVKPRTTIHGPALIAGGPFNPKGGLVMTMMKLLIGGAGLAAVGAAVPATAQLTTNVGMASERCTAAVQDRLDSMSGSSGRVVAVTKANPHKGFVTVWGLATSGAFGPSGVGAYGALGYSYAQPADLSFKCRVDYRGLVRNVDIDRRYKR